MLAVGLVVVVVEEEEVMVVMKEVMAEGWCSLPARGESLGPHQDFIGNGSASPSPPCCGGAWPLSWPHPS